MSMNFLGGAIGALGNCNSNNNYCHGSHNHGFTSQAGLAAAGNESHGDCVMTCTPALGPFGAVIDLGVDLSPVRERIHQCKQRYHRDLWRIICDTGIRGGDGENEGGGGDGEAAGASPATGEGEAAEAAPAEAEYEEANQSNQAAMMSMKPSQRGLQSRHNNGMPRRSPMDQRRMLEPEASGEVFYPTKPTMYIPCYTQPNPLKPFRQSPPTPPPPPSPIPPVQPSPHQYDNHNRHHQQKQQKRVQPVQQKHATATLAPFTAPKAVLRNANNSDASWSSGSGGGGRRRIDEATNDASFVAIHCGPWMAGGHHKSSRQTRCAKAAQTEATSESLSDLSNRQRRRERPTGEHRRR